MSESEVAEVLGSLLAGGDTSAEYARFVLKATHEQRIKDGNLIRAYADQLPDDHPAKKYIIEISDTLLSQK